MVEPSTVASVYIYVCVFVCVYSTLDGGGGGQIDNERRRREGEEEEDGVASGDCLTMSSAPWNERRSRCLCEQRRLLWLAVVGLGNETLRFCLCGDGQTLLGRHLVSFTSFIQTSEQTDNLMAMTPP